MGNAGYGNHTQDNVDSKPSDPGANQSASPGKQPGKGGKTDDGCPPAGPHAKPSLTNPDATPGAGTLPSSDRDNDVDPGSG